MASVSAAELHELYVISGKSIPDIAEILGITYSQARTILINAGIPLRSRADGIRAAKEKLGKHMIGKKREFSDKWKANISASKAKRSLITAAGVSKKTNGYIAITMGANKHRSEHVVIMEKHIGRRLKENEVVHHIDGNKHNNVLENLMLMTRSEHTKLHRNERN